MAISDIRIKVSLRGHPKRAKLELLIGPGATGHLLDLWISAAQTRPDGVLSDLDDDDIAIMANWTGRSTDLTAALVAVRFLSRRDGVYVLHDWAEHQSWVVGHIDRQRRGKKAIDARWEMERERRGKDAERPGDAKPDTVKMPEAGPKNGENIRRVYDENTGSNTETETENTRSNTPLLSLPGRLNTPPVAPSGATPPRGGTPKGKSRFVQPSVDEIATYCEERGNGLDAAHIHAHYTANGWKVGRNPMRDWRAAVRTWESRSRQEQRDKASRASQTPAARLLAEAKGGTPQ